MEPNRFFIASPHFSDGEDIPIEHTADGGNLSPPLEWSQIPPSTQSFALLCDDPDAPVETPYIHWIIYNIPKDVVMLPEGVPPKDLLSSGALQGLNSHGTLGYFGPKPPPDTGVHRYYFRLFALDARLPERPGFSVEEFYDSIRNHILGEAEIVGRYAYQ